MIQRAINGNAIFRISSSILAFDHFEHYLGGAGERSSAPFVLRADTSSRLSARYFSVVFDLMSLAYLLDWV